MPRKQACVIMRWMEVYEAERNMAEEMCSEPTTAVRVEDDLAVLGHIPIFRVGVKDY